MYLNFGANIENRVFSNIILGCFLFPQDIREVRYRCREKYSSHPSKKESGIKFPEGGKPQKKRWKVREIDCENWLAREYTPAH